MQKTKRYTLWPEDAFAYDIKTKKTVGITKKEAEKLEIKECISIINDENKAVSVVVNKNIKQIYKQIVISKSNQPLLALTPGTAKICISKNNLHIKF